MIVFAPVYHGPLKDYGFCHLVDGTERNALSAAFMASSRRIDLRTAGMLRYCGVGPIASGGRTLR
jgi:hypothetical protein